MLRTPTVESSKSVEDMAGWMQQWLASDDEDAPDELEIEDPSTVKKRKRGKETDLDIAKRTFKSLLYDWDEELPSLPKNNSDVAMLEHALDNLSNEAITKTINDLWSRVESFGLHSMNNMATRFALCARILLTFRTTQYFIYLLSAGNHDIRLAHSQLASLNKLQIKLAEFGQALEKTVEGFSHQIKRINEIGACVSELLFDLKKIMNVSQFGRFMVWVNTDPACGAILDALWTSTISRVAKNQRMSTVKHSVNEREALVAENRIHSLDMFRNLFLGHPIPSSCITRDLELVDIAEMKHHEGVRNVSKYVSSLGNYETCVLLSYKISSGIVRGVWELSTIFEVYHLHAIIFFEEDSAIMSKIILSRPVARNFDVLNTQSETGTSKSRKSVIKHCIEKLFSDAGETGSLAKYFKDDGILFDDDLAQEYYGYPGVLSYISKFRRAFKNISIKTIEFDSNTSPMTVNFMISANYEGGSGQSKTNCTCKYTLVVHFLENEVQIQNAFISCNCDIIKQLPHK